MTNHSLGMQPFGCAYAHRNPEPTNGNIMDVLQQPATTVTSNQTETRAVLLQLHGGLEAQETTVTTITSDLRKAEHTTITLHDKLGGRVDEMQRALVDHTDRQFRTLDDNILQRQHDQQQHNDWLRNDMTGMIDARLKEHEELWRRSFDKLQQETTNDTRKMRQDFQETTAQARAAAAAATAAPTRRQMPPPTAGDFEDPQDQERGARGPSPPHSADRRFPSRHPRRDHQNRDEGMAPGFSLRTRRHPCLERRRTWHRQRPPCSNRNRIPAAAFAGEWARIRAPLHLGLHRAHRNGRIHHEHLLQELRSGPSMVASGIRKDQGRTPQEPGSRQHRRGHTKYAQGQLG